MPRSQARIHTSIWHDDDFLARSGAAQRVYFLLLSQPTITLCGVLAYTPKRWARLASDQTPEAIVAALEELEESEFVVSDLDTEEILVRSFMRQDGVNPHNPKVWKSAMEQVGHVSSSRIGLAISLEVARILGLDAPPNAPCDEASTDIDEDLEDDPPDGLRTNAYAASSSTSTSASTTTIGEPPASPRDELFEAICEVCKINRVEITPAIRGPLNRCRAELAGVRATPAEVQTRSRRYHQRFPDISLSPSALAKHWASLGEAPQVSSRERPEETKAKRLREIDAQLRTEHRIIDPDFERIAELEQEKTKLAATA